MDMPEKPTPDSLTLWCELQDIVATPEWQEFADSQAEMKALRERALEIEKRAVTIIAVMGERVDDCFDITPQVKALRFALREAALISKQEIHAAARMSRALMAVSEKLSAIINEE
jgi:hypothetical protein